MKKDKIELTNKPYASDGTTDNYKPLSFYQGQVSTNQNGFSIFRSKENEEYYFTFNLGGEIILISEGYESYSERNAGLASVQENLALPDMYDRRKHPKGHFYFDLKAQNGQKIATSIWFETERKLNDGIQACAEWRIDDFSHHERLPKDLYLPCSNYAGQEGFNKFEKEALFYFSFVSSSGDVLMRSQAYSSTQGRDHGIVSVKSNIENREQWIFEEQEMFFFFILKANNGLEIARSCPYQNKEDRNKDFIKLQEIISKKEI